MICLPVRRRYILPSFLHSSSSLSFPLIYKFHAFLVAFLVAFFTAMADRRCSQPRLYMFSHPCASSLILHTSSQSYLLVIMPVLYPLSSILTRYTYTPLLTPLPSLPCISDVRQPCSLSTLTIFLSSYHPPSPPPSPNSLPPFSPRSPLFPAAHPCPSVAAAAAARGDP